MEYFNKHAEIDAPYNIKVTNVEYDVPSDYGPQHKLTLEQDGEPMLWFVKVESFDKFFGNSDPVGKEFIAMKNSPRGRAKYPFFTLEPVGVSKVEAPTPVPQSSSSEARAKSEMKSDLKDREILMTAFVKSLLENGSTSREDTVHIALTLAKEVKKLAYKWYAEDNLQ